MSPARTPPSTWSLICWPVIVSLIVVVVRLAGELAGIGAPWFSAEGGGGGAVVGVSWLIPIFGFWFGWRLTGAGYAPDRPGLSFLMHTATAILGIGAAILAVAVLKLEPLPNLAVAGAGLVVGAILAWKAWPRLVRATLLYALLVRLGVVAITALALVMGWEDTHFTKGATPFADDATLLDKLIRLATPQLTLWIAGTMGFGGILATAASMIRGRRADDAPDWN